MKASRSSILLGVCPAHLKFVGTLCPDDQGCLPRDANGKIKILSGLKRLKEESPVRLTVAPIFVFSGTREADIRETLSGVKDLGLTPEMVIMLGGVDPMNPADEDKFVELALGILAVAKDLGIDTVSSPAFEAWMSREPAKTGADFDAAVNQLVNAHQRIHREADLANSSIKSWNLEFLRPVEFSTFTNIRSAWEVVRKLNENIGGNFFRVLVDASHCGDSGLSVEENRETIREIAAAGALGAFHASSKTTRGCLTTDEGWIDALLTTCIETGSLETVIVEAFEHTDEGLEGLRAAVPGHGVDTTKGRNYDQLIIDGLGIIENRLSEFVQENRLQAS